MEKDEQYQNLARIQKIVKKLNLTSLHAIFKDQHEMFTARNKIAADPVQNGLYVHFIDRLLKKLGNNSERESGESPVTPERDTTLHDLENTLSNFGTVQKECYSAVLLCNSLTDRLEHDEQEYNELLVTSVPNSSEENNIEEVTSVLKEINEVSDRVNKLMSDLKKKKEDLKLMESTLKKYESLPPDIDEINYKIDELKQEIAKLKNCNVRN